MTTGDLIPARTIEARLPLLGLVLLATNLAALSPVVARAATFNIANGDVAGLIAAISTANSNPDADTISLATGGIYTLVAVNNSTYWTGPTGLPAISSRMTIDGNGATIQRSSAPDTPEFRIVYITGPNGDLTLNQVTIKGGRAAAGAPGYMGGGGGLRNERSKLLLVDSTVTDNNGSAGASNDGGGILNFCGALIVKNSTISGNRSFGGYGGGGILNHAYTPAPSPQNCVSTVTILNSTIFENRADAPAGFQGRGDAIADVFSKPGSVILKNSIIASPTQGLGNDCYSGAWASSGHNIAGDASCGLTGSGDLNGTNPLLGSLASNGGPTQTHAPLSGSPAVDAVPVPDCKDTDGATIATDQRGFARPQGAACDIGSVEAVVDPAQAVQSLIASINAMGLPGGVTNSLSAPLKNIDPNNQAAACNKLNAFISTVGGKLQNGDLTQVQADQLLDAANAIKASLGCA